MRFIVLLAILATPLLSQSAFAIDHWNGKVSTVVVTHTGDMQLLMQSINSPSPEKLKWNCPDNIVHIPKSTDETARSLFYSTAVIAYKDILEIRFGIAASKANNKPACVLRYISLKPR